MLITPENIIQKSSSTHITPKSCKCAPYFRNYNIYNSKPCQDKVIHAPGWFRTRSHIKQAVANPSLSAATGIGYNGGGDDDDDYYYYYNVLYYVFLSFRT
jgi:hypothetical protein